MPNHTVKQLVEMLNRVVGDGSRWDWKHDLRIATPVPSWRHTDGSLDKGYVEFQRQDLQFDVEGEPKPAYRIVAEGIIVYAAVEVGGHLVTLDREIGKSIEQS